MWFHQFIILLCFQFHQSILVFKQNLFQELLGKRPSCIKRPRIFKKDPQRGGFHWCWFWSRSIIQTKLCPQTEVNSGKQHCGAPVPRACVACIHCQRSRYCCLNNLFARSAIEPEVRCCKFTAQFWEWVWGYFWCPAVTTAESSIPKWDSKVILVVTKVLFHYRVFEYSLLPIQVTSRKVIDIIVTCFYDSSSPKH